MQRHKREIGTRYREFYPVCRASDLLDIKWDAHSAIVACVMRNAAHTITYNSNIRQVNGTGLAIINALSEYHKRTGDAIRNSAGYTP